MKQEARKLVVLSALLALAASPLACGGAETAAPGPPPGDEAGTPEASGPPPRDDGAAPDAGSDTAPRDAAAADTGPTDGGPLPAPRLLAPMSTAATSSQSPTLTW